jgi:hypothetical protein
MDNLQYTINGSTLYTKRSSHQIIQISNYHRQNQFNDRTNDQILFGNIENRHGQKWLTLTERILNVSTKVQINSAN